MHQKKAFIPTLALIFLICNHTFSQQIILQGDPDSLFPVTNMYNDHLSVSQPYYYQSGASVFNIVSNKGIYYLFGNFTDLATNQGSSLVLDTLTQHINTSQQWKINGLVYTSIPDGKGGFYIGGSFTKIGDSTRKYIAQIDKNGKPEKWNPVADSIVKQICQRNDTLFIAGYFSTISGKTKPCFAMYSINGDSLLNNGGYGPFSFMINIESFLIDKDTIIYAGTTYTSDGTLNTQPIRKYDFKNNTFLPWKLPFTEYGPDSDLLFNNDSSVIIYSSSYNGYAVIGIDKISGSKLYGLLPTFDLPAFGSNGSGIVKGLQIINNKVYLAGAFEKIIANDGSINYRQGFAAFNAATGALASDALPMTGYPSFLALKNNKLLISGKFTAINGVQRKNFAVLDTGTYNVGSWEISPTDPITSMAFSGGSVFISGYFNGIHSVSRTGFAAIDSATNAILPWAPQNTTSVEGKRILIHGDSLFILGITSRPSTCMINDFNSEFRVISVSTGANLSTGEVINFEKINDFAIDDNYLYVASGSQLRRCNLPSLTRDPSWGINFTGSGLEHSLTNLIIKGDTLFSVGDNRFTQPCTTIPIRRAWVLKYPLSTGIFSAYYSFQEANSTYTQPIFEHAILSGSKLFIQGIFRSLNDSIRTDYVCVNTDNGKITAWKPDFGVGINDQFNSRTSPLQLFQGKIWVGGSTGYALTSGNYFSGFGAIDTSSGKLNTPLMTIKENFVQGSYYVKNTVNDFFLNNNELIVVGSFDSVNNKPYCDIARYKIINSTLPVTLLSFTADLPDETDVHLKWSTATELNSDHFELLRSSDGANFTQIASVKAAGNGDLVRNYDYLDNILKVLFSNVLYYQLKQVDIDGNIQAFPVLSVKPGYNNSTSQSWPNPFVDHLQISLYAASNQTFALSIVSVDGKTVYRQQYSLAKGVNQISVSDLGGLAKGVYELRGFNQDKIAISKKIIKQ